MKVTKVRAMMRATMDSVRVSLALVRSRWRSWSRSSSASRMSSYKPWWELAWNHMYIPNAIRRTIAVACEIFSVWASRIAKLTSSRGLPKRVL